MTGSVPRKLLSVAEYSSLSAETKYASLSLILVLFFCIFSRALSISVGAHNERSVVHSEEEMLKIRNKREGKRKKKPTTEGMGA